MPMTTQTGSVSIDAQNIMPVIKRWLYSDKDIFLREVVSNACDAITKFRMVRPGAGEDMTITVTVDKEQGILSIADTGIGMTAEEVQRYINQVAFSGAEEFLKNVQGDKQEETSGIIGHFGLGFYSVFMVADHVTIQTLSYQEGAEAVQWESTDGMDFTISQGTRTAHGTTIILHISEEEKEFLDVWRVREVLKRYCGYMNTPIYLEDLEAKPTERQIPVEGETNEDGTPKMTTVTEEPRPQLINDPHPLWLKKPSECTDEEYKTFYHKMFTDMEDPLFWIHLNVDYPFNLKGILYFPRLKQDFGVREGEIKLFSGQVFVADNIKEVIPEFLMLLRGVIDCPDLPLNVSRSFLQNDGYVKRISTHITKKVADKLMELFHDSRETYEGYWDDISPFVKYGCIKDAKFYDQVKDALLLKTTEGKYLTLSEYTTRNGDKAESKIYYTNDPKRQAASVALYTRRGMDVAVMDTLVDGNFQSFLEYSGTKVTFARVDADVSSLTEETEEGKELDAAPLTELFRKAVGQEELPVELKPLADQDLAAMVTEEEQSRRFQEMSRYFGQSFAMPSRYTLVLNRRNPTIAFLSGKSADDETALLMAQQVYDLARMAAKPLESEEITAFLTRSNRLLEMMAAEKNK